MGRPPREADDIANLAFIGGKTNRTIGDKAPNVYLKPILEAGSSSSLAAQCMPTSEDLLQAEGYDPFLTARRELIAERLNVFLNTAGLEQDSTHIDPRLRDLDKQITWVELQLRKVVHDGLDGDKSLLPIHVDQKVSERLAAARRANPTHDGSSDELSTLLEFCDFRELQDVFTARALWKTFEPQFGTKENLNNRFGQLAALRNAICHNRTMDDVTQKDGEVALLWFRRVLGNARLPR